MADRTRGTQIQLMIDAAVQAVQTAMQQQIDAINAQATADRVHATDQIAALSNQNTVLQAAVQAAQQHAPHQPAMQQQAPPAIVQPVQFAYTPGTYGQAATLIDYNTPNGAKIQKAATEKLNVIHDLDAEHLNDFLEAFRTRGIAQGWFNSLLSVTQNGIPMNFIDNYGVVTYESTKTMANSYMFQPTRAAQDSHNMFSCLEASLTNDARTTLYAEQDKYTLRRGTLEALPGSTIPAGGDANERRRDGLLFIWCILDRTTAKTNATISTIVRQLNHLAELMVEHDSDVAEFNTHVRQLMPITPTKEKRLTKRYYFKTSLKPLPPATTGRSSCMSNGRNRNTSTVLPSPLTH
jgi:hypothetical protein